MTRIKGIDADLYPVNLGGNPFGWTAGRDESFAILDAFRDGGGNFIDTADSYSAWAPGNHGGESEAIIGEWLATLDNRDQMVVATKVGSWDRHRGLDRATVDAALDDSLERLRLDRIDLYYAHFDDESVAISDQVDTFASLVESGRIRAYGLSNYTPERMAEFFATAADRGLALPVAIQPNYSLVHRHAAESSYLPIAERYGAVVCSYYSLASGFLTGKYRRLADTEGVTRGGSVQPYLTDVGLALLAALDDLAQARQTSVATVSLAWLRAKGVVPIASASQATQLSDLLAAGRLDLTDAEVARLDAASASFA